MEALLIVVVVFAFLLAVFLVLAFRFPEDLKKLLGRLRSVEFTKDGLKIELLAAAIHEKEKRTPAEAEILPLIERIPSGRRVLWVDDLPANNRGEIQALRGLGLTVDTATSNAEALSYAENGTYDLVLSDIGRAPPEAATDGLMLPKALEKINVHTPIAFYVGNATAASTPTNQPVFDTPTQLLDWISDQLGGAHR